MTPELIRSDRLYDGVPYHYAAIGAGVQLVFTAGACPLDRQGSVVSGDAAAQARQTLANLQTALEAAGCKMGRRDQDDCLRRVIPTRGSGCGLGRIRARLRDPRPAEHLARRHNAWIPGQLVEIEAIAMRDTVAPPHPQQSGPSA